MSLTGFLTGIGSIFSGLQGDKTSTSGSKTENQSLKSNTAAVTSEKGTSSSDTLSSRDAVVSSTSATNQHTATQQQTKQSGTSDTQQTAAEKSKQNQITTTYSSDVLASLDSLLKGQLTSGTAEQATDAIAGRLQQVQADAASDPFDVGGYVSGIAAAAGAATQSDLDSRINATLSATGTSETGNSMSALLGNRMRNEAAASLAGIVSNATATGEQIKQQQSQNFTGQISELASGLAGQLRDLLGVAQGGRQETQALGETSSQQASATQDTATQLTTGTEDVASRTKSTETQHVRDKQFTDTTTAQAGTQMQTTQQTGTSTTNADSTSKTGGDIFSTLFGALSKSAGAA